MTAHRDAFLVKKERDKQKIQETTNRRLLGTIGVGQKREKDQVSEERVSAAAPADDGKKKTPITDVTRSRYDCVLRRLILDVNWVYIGVDEEIT